MRIRGFSPYFSLPTSSPDSRRSTDPVTQLWDLFSTGTPLCYIFDQLPEDAGFNKINNSSFDTEQYEANPDRVMKRAILLFAMQIREEKVAKEIPGCEPFTVTDLWDRNSTDGLVKVRFVFFASQYSLTHYSLQVINTVTAIVDYLPPDVFQDAPLSSPTMPENGSYDSLADTLAPTPSNAQESARNNIIKETVETERKYVQDLEIMQVSLLTPDKSTPAHFPRAEIR
jgi:cell division control protein 24